jgi:hypothetical protein
MEGADTEEHQHQQRKEMTGREPMRRKQRLTTAAQGQRLRADAAVRSMTTGEGEVNDCSGKVGAAS